MIRLAPHYIDEPPEGEPPHGYCPRCDYALVDANECRCGWYELAEARGEAAPESAEDRLLAEGLRQLERAGRAVKAGGER